MSGITTHVLDTASGRPAAGVRARLERARAGTAAGGPAGEAPDRAGGWEAVGEGVTDADGRCRSLLPEGAPVAGTWRLTFDTGAYFAATGVAGFYPWVTVVFTVAGEGQHYHVPLLLSPHGYTTYRGS